MAEVINRAESNIRERGRNVLNVVSAEVRTGKSAISDLTGLRPVAAVVDLVDGTTHNLATLVKTQAEITRRWVPL